MPYYHGIIEGSIMDNPQHCLSESIDDILFEFEMDIDGMMLDADYPDPSRPSHRLNYLAYDRSMSTIQTMVDLALTGSTEYATIDRDSVLGWDQCLCYYIEEISEQEYNDLETLLNDEESWF